MATKFTPATQNAMRLVSPEIKALPSNWTASHEDTDPYEIFYTGPPDENGQSKRTYTHPALGPLPENWRLCYYLVDKKKKKREPRYWNTKTKEAITENPRYLPETLKARESRKAPCMQTRVGSSIIKNKPGLLEKGHRGPVGTKPSLRDNFEIVHVIDAGDGSIGGMNGGVFVVRVKGQPELYVEKRFKPENWELVRREVELVHRLRTGGVTQWCAGFVDDLSMTASLITEYCDRGSWDNIIKKYKLKRRELCEQGSTQPLPFVPELFLWHAFLGLADAFAYLQGGRSYASDPVDDPPAGPVKGWVPIIHRDMKPDNALMRARSTLGSSKYFYCVLSDFGVACEDNGLDMHQKNGALLGTHHYQPPELRYDPYPTDENNGIQRLIYPGKARHSSATDIWALGASIFNLARTDAPFYKDSKGARTPYDHAMISHLSFENQPSGVDVGSWIAGRASLIPDMSVPGEYSDGLNEAVLIATCDDRPDAINMVKELTRIMRDNGISGGGPRIESDRLPPWSVTIPDFYARMDI